MSFVSRIEAHVSLAGDVIQFPTKKNTAPIDKLKTSKYKDRVVDKMTPSTDKYIDWAFKRVSDTPKVESSLASIDARDILVERDSIFKTLGDIGAGRTSKTKGPLDVFHLTEGENKGKYLLQDGFHRLFMLLLNHEENIKVNVVGSGGPWNTDYATPMKPFDIDPSLTYMGLEDLADEEILEELKDPVARNWRC